MVDVGDVHRVHSIRGFWDWGTRMNHTSLWRIPLWWSQVPVTRFKGFHPPWKVVSWGGIAVATGPAEMENESKKNNFMLDLVHNWNDLSGQTKSARQCWLSTILKIVQHTCLDSLHICFFKLSVHCSTGHKTYTKWPSCSKPVRTCCVYIYTYLHIISQWTCFIVLLHR